MPIVLTISDIMNGSQGAIVIENPITPRNKMSSDETVARVAKHCNDTEVESSTLELVNGIKPGKIASFTYQSFEIGH